jgi:DnaJ-domain-containing protein 1
MYEREVEQRLDEIAEIRTALESQRDSEAPDEVRAIPEALELLGAILEELRVLYGGGFGETAGFTARRKAEVEEAMAVLGVSEAATEADIRQAYRKRAVKYHPDRNPNDKGAEEMFKRVNNANEVLKNEMRSRKARSHV